MTYFRHIATALVTALLVAGIAVASGVEGQGGRPSIESDQAAVHAVAPELSRAIAAFRGPQRAEDRLTGNPVEDLRELGDALPGESPNLSRRFKSAGGEGVFVWPAYGHVCYSVANSGGCGSIDRLARDGVMVSARTTGLPEDISTVVHQALAIVRDGISEIEVRTRSGQAVTAKVTDNVVFLENLPSPASEARWTNPDGSDGSVPIPGG